MVASSLLEQGWQRGGRGLLARPAGHVYQRRRRIGSTWSSAWPHHLEDGRGLAHTLAPPPGVSAAIARPGLAAALTQVEEARLAVEDQSRGRQGGDGGHECWEPPGVVAA